MSAATRHELEALLERHKAACDLGQPFDERAVHRHLAEWLANIGAPPCRIHTGRYAGADWVVDASSGHAGRAAIALRGAWETVRGRHWFGARADGRSGSREPDDWASQTARYAWAKSMARVANVAMSAGAGTETVGDWKLRDWDRFFGVHGMAARGAWDASHRSMAAIGAHWMAETSLAGQWMPLFRAFEAGLYVFWVGDTDVWIAPAPSVIKTDQERNLHCSDGPAFIWQDDVRLYFWRGQIIPERWITTPGELTPELATTQKNAELRRSACEILGWDRILPALDARVIDADADPEIGTLFAANLSGSGEARFVRVRCGTGRTLVIPVSRHAKTALEAVASTYGLTPTDYRPEGRT